MKVMAEADHHRQRRRAVVDRASLHYRAIPRMSLDANSVCGNE